MTYETTLLGNESGTQYTGVKDKSGGTGSSPVAVLLTGVFKRGRFDKPMTITGENIRAQLGYEPKNPSYIAVQDALNSGVPSVQVLRLKGEDSSKISCAGARSEANFSSLDDGYNLKINGVLHETEDNLPAYIRDNLDSVLGCNNDGFCDIWNRSDTDYQRIELIPTRPRIDMNSMIVNLESQTTPIHLDPFTGIITFCLIPSMPS